jgi:hypothetical protein
MKMLIAITFSLWRYILELQSYAIQHRQITSACSTSMFLNSLLKWPWGRRWWSGSDLSLEMALRFEMAIGVSMDLLMCMQNSYDIASTIKGTNAIMMRGGRMRLGGARD